MTNPIRSWLAPYFGTTDFALTPLAGDASFRRYFRVNCAEKNFIVMDAAAEKEKCPQFIAIANALRSRGLCTPAIFAEDLAGGRLLLSDLGDDLYLTQLNPMNAEQLYGNALHALSILAGCKKISGHEIPLFTKEFMREELHAFQSWFLENHLGLNLSIQTNKQLSTLFDLLAEQCSTQPLCFMHRDYHSANLMVLPENRVGILDFQDAFIGPVTYDLVSLLRDCYIQWPNDLVVKLALCYREKLHIACSENEFLRWFDWMGMQRHLKALLTFSRKYRRDHNANYLHHIPRTVNYLLDVSAQYSEFNFLTLFLKDNVMEKIACAP